MPSLNELKDEFFGIISEQFKNAKVWKGEEDVQLVKTIATRMAENRLKLLTGSEEEKKSAQRSLPFLMQAVKNDISAKRIALEGFGQDVMMAIVETAVKVGLKALTGFL